MPGKYEQTLINTPMLQNLQNEILHSNSGIGACGKGRLQHRVFIPGGGEIQKRPASPGDRAFSEDGHETANEIFG